MCVLTLSLICVLASCQGNERSQLLEAIRSQIALFKLQPSPAFINKCVELYDTVLVRHGLMLVGAASAGKSQSLRTLQRAVTSLAGQGNHKVVNCSYINPKSIQLNQLYGADNPATLEWSDGVLPVQMRQAVLNATTGAGSWEWVVFDGQ